MHKVRISSECLEHGCKTICKKVEVFKETQYSKICCNTNEQQSLSLSITFGMEQCFSNQKIHQGGNQQQRAKPPVPIPIKQVTGQQEEAVPAGFCLQQVEGWEDNCEENQEYEGVEEQGRGLRFRVYLFICL